MAPSPSPDDDELDELPPIDGDEVDDGEPPLDEIDEDEGDDGDPLDDATGEGDPVGEDELDIAGDESGWLEDAGEAEQLDVGTPETFGEEEGAALLEGADEPDAEEEEEIGFGEEASGLADAGEEGFEDEDEALEEEELPQMDAGPDDVESDDHDLGEGLPDDDATEEPRPPWADRAWERADEDVRGLAAVDALAITPRGVVVGGQGLARIEPKGRVVVLEALGLRGGAPTALVVDGDHVALATPRAGVLVSADGGRSFVEANGWRGAVAGDDAVVDLVGLGDELWARTKGGAVVWSADRGRAWARVDGVFDALARDGERGEVVALARTAGESSLARGARGALVRAPAAALPAGRVVGFAARAGRVAVGIAGRGAFRDDASSGGGGDGSDARTTWQRVEGTASLSGLTFGPAGSLLVALASEAEARAWIALAHDGAPAGTVAELGEPSAASSGARAGGDGEDGGGAAGWASDDDDAARVRALAWDDAAGLLWAAGGFGLGALRPSRR